MFGLRIGVALRRERDRAAIGEKHAIVLHGLGQVPGVRRCGGSFFPGGGRICAALAGSPYLPERAWREQEFVQAQDRRGIQDQQRAGGSRDALQPGDPVP